MSASDSDERTEDKDVLVTEEQMTRVARTEGNTAGIPSLHSLHFRMRSGEGGVRGAVAVC
jgi:hypothetical protein